MPLLVPPDRLTEYGYPRNYSNRHRRRLEDIGLLSPRVPLNHNQHAYVDSELKESAKAYAEAMIAKRDAKPKAKPLFPPAEVAAHD
jgi:hypothetical protein